MNSIDEKLVGQQIENFEKMEVSIIFFCVLDLGLLKILIKKYYITSGRSM